MIDATRSLLALTDARIDEIVDEFERLQTLRDALDVSRQALVAFIDQPEQAPREAMTPAPAPRPAAVPSPPGSVSPAITQPGQGKGTLSVEPPAVDGPPARVSQPGSARSGSREQTAHGRRAPAAKAAAPSPSASGLVGTPTPASQLPARRGGVSGAQPSPSPAASTNGRITCACGVSIRANGVGPHRRLSRVHAAFIAGEATPTKARSARRTAPRTATPRETAAGSVLCPTCSDWFLPDRIAEHRVKRHAYKPGQPTEQYLCSRCSEGFATLDEKMAHQETHPALPLAMEPVGSNPTVRKPLEQRGLGVG